MFKFVTDKQKEFFLSKKEEFQEKIWKANGQNVSIKDLKMLKNKNYTRIIAAGDNANLHVNLLDEIETPDVEKNGFSKY